MAKKRKPAVYFLGIVAVLVFLFVGVGTIWALYPWQIMQWTYVPAAEFSETEAPAAPDYALNDAWFALPGTPAETAMRPGGISGKSVIPDVDVFFIHPTTYLKSKQWNAPLDDADATRRARLFSLKNQASAFNLAGRMIAPKYRQATFGAFLDDSGDGVKAVMLAHQDILAAFDTFIADINNGRPFIIAGHSQGALHGLLLLQNRIAGTELADRMVAAYLIGWPIGIESDIGALEGIDVCSSERDTGCVVSWLSFAPNGDPAEIAKGFTTTPGLNGAARSEEDILCTNPLSWQVGGSASAAQNLGAVGAFENAEPLVAPELQLVGATCKDGFLYLTSTPQSAPWRSKILPGENYHVHDINLFYMNLRFNAVKRVRAFLSAGNR